MKKTLACAIIIACSFITSGCSDNDSQTNRLVRVSGDCVIKN